MITKATVERFWNKVRKDFDCWMWIGARNDFGYGHFLLHGKCKLAHRVAYEICWGHQPKLFVLHSCDNPSCVNPDHLREGTQKENVADSIRRGRYINGKSKKTHCPKGHPYSGENLYIRPSGSNRGRGCLLCRKESGRK